METYKLIRQIRRLGNLRGTETLFTGIFWGLHIICHHELESGILNSIEKILG